MRERTARINRLGYQIVYSLLREQTAIKNQLVKRYVVYDGHKWKNTVVVKALLKLKWSVSTQLEFMKEIRRSRLTVLYYQ